MNEALFIAGGIASYVLFAAGAISLLSPGSRRRCAIALLTAGGLVGLATATTAILAGASP